MKTKLLGPLGRLVLPLVVICAVSTGCALHTSYDVKMQRTHVEGRVGVEKMTVVDFTADLPAHIDIEVNSDVAVAAIDATVGGGIVRAVWISSAL